MLRSLLEMAFRLSFITARSRDDAATANWTQTVPLAGVDTRVVFTTHWPFAAVAVALTLLAWAAVLPLYAGWWRLGRSMTLSPLETAVAFDAPLLRGAVPSNARAERIVERVGGVKVRYGVQKEAAAYTAVAAAAAAAAPAAAATAADVEDGQGGGKRGGQEMRLRFGTGHVETPVNGMRLA
jgi:hypothetical protein